MKKILLFGFLASVISFHAQTYSISPAKSVTFTAPFNNVTINDIYMVRTSGSTLSITWELISSTSPSGWDYSMCELGTCLTGIPQGPTTMSTSSGSGPQAFLGLNVDPSNIAGTGIVKVRVYVTGSPATADTLTWYVNAVASGVKENMADAQLLVHPNPVKDKLTLSTEHKEIVSVTLTDVTGRTVIAQDASSFSGQLDLSVLQNGYYILKVDTGNGVLYKRIIKE